MMDKSLVWSSRFRVGTASFLFLEGSRIKKKKGKISLDISREVKAPARLKCQQMADNFSLECKHKC